MKEKSTCEFGRELENLVVKYFQDININASRTNGSGNKGSLGDINNPFFVVECKNKSTSSITIKEEVWSKLVAEIPLHSKRLPMYVLGNKNKKVWCVLDIDTMFDILKGWKENK